MVHELSNFTLRASSSLDNSSGHRDHLHLDLDNHRLHLFHIGKLLSLHSLELVFNSC